MNTNKLIHFLKAVISVQENDITQSRQIINHISDFLKELESDPSLKEIESDLSKEPKINHEEALELAQFKKDNSNLARCYIQIIEKKDILNHAIELMITDMDGKFCPFDECKSLKKCNECLNNHYRSKSIQKQFSSISAEKDQG